MQRDLWNALFDDEWTQRRDSARMSPQIPFNEEQFVSQAEQIRTLQAKANRLELACSALVALLMEHEVFDAKQLKLAIARVDLADGFEDGMLGPERTRQAPKCGGCGQPANPNRDSCVFCGVPLKLEEPPPQSPPTLNCDSCGKEVVQYDTWITSRGTVCNICHNVEDGGLSVVKPASGALSDPDEG